MNENELHDRIRQRVTAAVIATEDTTPVRDIRTACQAATDGIRADVADAVRGLLVQHDSAYPNGVSFVRLDSVLFLLGQRP